MKRNPITVGWPMPYACPPGVSVTLGDDGTATPVKAPTLRERLSSEPVKTSAAIALTYHGYRRTGSILWALIYGLAGRTMPVVAVPISLAQGFGQKKSCP